MLRQCLCDFDPSTVKIFLRTLTLDVLICGDEAYTSSKPAAQAYIEGLERLGTRMLMLQDLSNQVKKIAHNKALSRG